MIPYIVSMESFYGPEENLTSLLTLIACYQNFSVKIRGGVKNGHNIVVKSWPKSSY